MIYKVHQRVFFIIVHVLYNHLQSNQGLNLVPIEQVQVKKRAYLVADDLTVYYLLIIFMTSPM